MISTEKPFKTGLIIGSGGIKTLGIIPLFSLLEKNNIIPDLLIGCSGGSVLSSLWASGAPLKDLDTLVSQYCELIKQSSLFRMANFRTLLNIQRYSEISVHTPSALLKGEWVLDFLRHQFHGKKIENNKIKTLLAATNFKTGKPVFLNHGPLAESIYASCALYPVLPPIYLHNQWLVDGGYYSAMPIFDSTKTTCDKILSISFSESPGQEHNSFFEFYMDFISQAFNQNARKQNSFAVHYHHDEVLFINFHFDRPLNFWNINDLSYIGDVIEKTLEDNKDAIIHFLTPDSACNEK